MLFRERIEIIVISILLLCASLEVQAQVATDSTASKGVGEVSLIELTFNRASPVGGYANALDKSLYGASFTYLHHKDIKRYYFFGFDISFSHLGSLSGTILNNGDSFNDRSVTNHISTQLVFRQFAPFYWSGFEPFIEGKFGPQVFYTSTSSTFFDEAGTTNFMIDQTDFGLAYALGIGLTYNIYEAWHLLFKMSYNGSTATSFLVPADTLTTEFPIDNFTSATTQAQFLSLQFGFTYSL